MAKNNLKTIYTENNVTATHMGRGKWKFAAVDGVMATNYSLVETVPGGKETVLKVAGILNGSLKRTKNVSLVDGMARGHIRTLIAAKQAA